MLTTDVGRVTAWGRLVGNHHLGVGGPRDVSVLKAANMALRLEALALPRDLRGEGAQVHHEVATSLWAVESGWRLVYDPAILVDHGIGPRFDADRRWDPEPVAVEHAAYNLVACMLSIRHDLYWRRAAYGLLIGDRSAPGLIRAVAAIGRRERGVLRRLGPSIRGQAHALRDTRRRPGIPMRTFVDDGPSSA